MGPAAGRGGGTAGHVDAPQPAARGRRRSGGGGKLASTPAEKKAAANTIDTELLTRTQTAGKHADEATGSAARALDGWATGTALKKVQTTWEGQVKTLMGRLGRERDGLRGTVTVLGGVDADRGSRIKQVKSPFAEYE